MFNTSVFSDNKIEIPEDCDVVFVSDMFSSDHVGGAELTTDSLIDASHLNVFRLHSRDISMDVLSEGVEKYWIFGNFSGMDLNLIPSVVANLKYSIVEYDYKYCRYRSTEKHFYAENLECNCHNEDHGKLISAFYYGSRSLWWMSQNQMERYHDKFPFLTEKKNYVLSSIFSDDFFSRIIEKAKSAKGTSKEKWIITGSPSWIKGTPDAIAYCEKEGLDYEVLWEVPYDQMLDKLSRAKGLVHLPKGADTCPRLVIEAKLLGCDIITNSNVQHTDESWFSTDSIKDIVDYLRDRPGFFWSNIEKNMAQGDKTISGYTTTLNCIEQDYPFVESISSMLGFCDQVVVVDGGSTDGTWEKVQEIAESDSRVTIHRQERDWDSKRFAVFDGLQKALARALCVSEFCWQQDSDEVIHPTDYSKIREVSKQFPNNVDLIALPVIEYWGSEEKVRIDVNPWKWRMSRNKPHITHGIPGALRRFDNEGRLYAAIGTDGCDYVRSDDFSPIPCGNFYTREVHDVRLKALSGNVQAIEAYENWFNNCIHSLPSIQHFSWFNIGRKIRTYRDYWSKHWQSLYDIEQEDTEENNMFFDKTWADVSEDEIKDLASKLSDEMGGWIFHEKVDFDKKTPFIDSEIGVPEIMTSWTKRQ